MHRLPAAGRLTTSAWRNISRTASLPNVPSLTTTGINNYSLYFDYTGITLPAMTVGGALTITAGGTIKQTGVLTAATANFTVRGDNSIVLIASNSISGAVGLNSPRSSQVVSFTNASGIQIGSSQLGRASLFLTAQSGNITTAVGGNIEQEPDALGALLTVQSGSVISLNGR